MNCIIHHDVAAVNTCNICNGGVCGNCFNKQLTIWGKIVCESCFIEKCKEAIIEGENALTKIKKIKRDFTIILMLGLIVAIVTIVWLLIKHINEVEKFKNIILVSYILASIVWGFHVFFDGVVRIPREKSVQEQIMDAQMIHDNTIWAWWGLALLFKITEFLFRGMLFPIFYFIHRYRLEKDKKQIQDNMQHTRSHMNDVYQYGDLYGENVQN